MNELQSKHIVLTGAAGGIGSAIAYELVGLGATLILVGRNEAALNELNLSLGGGHHCIACDIADEGQRKDLIDFCEQADFDIDMLINNAGMSEFNLLADSDPLKISQLVTVNLTSPILLCQAFLPLLARQSSASIINIGSTFGSIGFAGFSVYSSTKFGLRGFSEALRRELADTAISVRYFAPRATKTQLNNSRIVAMNNELGTQMDDAEQVAKAFAYFVTRSTRSQYYYGWPEKLFVKINSILPNIVDKSLLKKLPIIKRYVQA